MTRTIKETIIKEDRLPTFEAHCKHCNMSVRRYEYHEPPAIFKASIAIWRELHQDCKENA